MFGLLNPILWFILAFKDVNSVRGLAYASESKSPLTKRLLLPGGQD